MRVSVETAVTLRFWGHILKVVHTTTQKPADFVLKLLPLKDAKLLRELMLRLYDRHKLPFSRSYGNE